MQPACPVDLALLDRFQRDLPLVRRPFAALAAALGLEEGEVIARLTRLHEEGRVARVGATVRPNTAGASTLAAMAVPEARIEAVAALVGAEPGVNHSYLREAEWNLWFVATAPHRAGLAASLGRIAAGAGLRVLDLRLVRPFNIDLGFRMAGGPVAMPAPRAAVPVALLPGDRPLLEALSHGLPLVAKPFAALARSLAREEEGLRDRIGALVAGGVITRLGVIVRHRALGYTANAMVVWDPPADDLGPAGQALAALPGVTLAYERRPVAGVWPWRLYSMIHARTREEALAVLDRARALPALAGAPCRVLFSTRCFKQTGARLTEAA
jgi:DNA-binding Lrp family transcriptional regulator